MMTDSEMEKNKKDADGKELVSRSKGFGFVCFRFDHDDSSLFDDIIMSHL